MVILAVTNTKCIILKHPSVITGKNFLRSVYMQNIINFKGYTEAEDKLQNSQKNHCVEELGSVKQSCHKQTAYPTIYFFRRTLLILEEREKGVAFFPPLLAQFMALFLFSTLCIMHL